MAAGSTLLRSQLIAPPSLLEGQESQLLSLQAEGIEIDEDAALLTKLTDLASFRLFFQSLLYIPLLNRSKIVLAGLSALFVLLIGFPKWLAT